MSSVTCNARTVAGVHRALRRDFTSLETRLVQLGLGLAAAVILALIALVLALT